MDDSDTVERLAQSDASRQEVDAFRLVDFYSSVENTLSNRDLNILRYYYEYGYTSAELSGWLGISESCFKVRVLRMKQKLKRSMTVFPFLLFIFGGGIVF